MERTLTPAERKEIERLVYRQLQGGGGVSDVIKDIGKELKPLAKKYGKKFLKKVVVPIFVKGAKKIGKKFKKRRKKKKKKKEAERAEEGDVARGSGALFPVGGQRRKRKLPARDSRGRFIKKK